MPKSRFESIGCYMPAKVVTSKELMDNMKIKPIFDLEDITGIKNRRYRSETEDSFQLGLAAARDCLSHSKYKAEDIEAVIWTSITQFKNGAEFQFEPCMSIHIKNGLGAQGAMNFDISNACAGMLTGVYILDNLIRAGIVKNGLVLSGECISHIADTALKEITEPIDDQFASLTVGDSGAAVIMDESPNEEEGLEISEFLTFAECAELCLGMPSALNPGIAMYAKAVELHSESVKRTPRFLSGIIEKYEYVLRKQTNKTRPMDFVIPHQTALKIMKSAIKEVFAYVKTIEKVKDIEMPEMLAYIQEFGNTSSTSHFVVLYHALKDKKVKPGNTVLMVPHASGISIGLFFLKLGNLEV
jgi:3-oxoacyl-[acyl-carrier-protein] synthase III